MGLFDKKYFSRTTPSPKISQNVITRVVVLFLLQYRARLEGREPDHSLTVIVDYRLLILGCVQP